MRNRYDEKNQSLLMRFFKTVSIYLFLSLACFFGYIKINGNVDPTIVSIPIITPGADASSEFSNLLEGLMSIKSLDVDIDLGVETKQDTLSVDGNVRFDINDLENLSLQGDLNIGLAQDLINVKFLFLNNYLYLTLNENSFILPVSNLDNEKFNIILDLVSKSVNNETMSGMLNTVQDIIGVDFSDVSALLNFLRNDFVKDETGYDFDLYFGNLSAKVLTDLEFNLKSFVLNPLTIKNDGQSYKITLNADVNKVNNNEIEFDIDDFDSKDALDLSKVIDILSSGILNLRTSLRVNGQNYNALIKLDYSDINNVKFELSDLNILGRDIGLRYQNSTIYLNFGGYKIAQKIDSNNNILAEIKDLFEKLGLNVDINEEINNILGSIKNINFDINELLNKLDYEIVLDNSSIRLAVKDFDNYSEKLNCQNLAVVDILKSQDLEIELRLELIDRINLDITLLESVTKIEDFTEDELNAYTTLNSILEVVKNGKFDIGLTLKLNNKNYDANVKIDLSDISNIKLEIKDVYIYGKQLKINVQDNTIFVSYGEYKICETFVGVNQIFEKLSAMLKKFDISIDVSNKLPQIDIENIDFGSLLNKLQFRFNITEDKFGLVIKDYDNLNDKFGCENLLVLNIISLQSRLEFEMVVFDNYSAILNIAESKQDIVLLTDDEKLEFISLDEIIDVILSGKFDINLKLTINNKIYNANAKIDFSDVSNIIFELKDLVVLGKELQINIQDNVIYISYGDNKLYEKFENYNEIYEKIIKILQKFNISIDFNKNLPQLDLENVDFEDILNKLDYSLCIDENQFVIVIKDYDNLKDKFACENLAVINLLSLNSKVDFEVVLFDNYDARFTLSASNEDIRLLTQEEIASYEMTIQDIIDIADNTTDLYESAKTDFGYAFSANIGVRYSTTTFEGNIAVLLYADGENITPYIYLHTTSLGLDTYLYYIDDYLLIDLQGLKIKFVPTKDNIDYLLNWATQTFNLDIDLSATANDLNIVLPKLEDLYINLKLQAITLGLDMLPYLQNEGVITAYFDDILLEVGLMQNNIQNIILSADIIDPNTSKKYDSYEEFKLSYENGYTVTKNFAVYIQDFAFGNFVEYSDLFEYFNGKLVAVKTGDLTDFYDFTLLTNLVDYVYNYFLNGEVAFNAQLEMLSGNVANMLASGDISIQAKKYGDDLVVKSLGDNLVLTTNSNSHAMRYYYDDNDLYLSYNHGLEINDTVLKGKFSKVSLQNILGIVLGIFDIDLGDIGTNLGINKSTSDFDYVKSLLGLDEKLDVTDEKDYVDNLLSSVQNILSILDNINYTYKNSKNIRTDKIVLTLKLYGNTSKIEIVAENNRLKSINISNFAISYDEKINAVISFNDFSETVFDTYDTSGHIDNSNIANLLESGINTLNTKEYHYAGKLTVSYGININANVTLDAYFDENNNIILDVNLSHSTSFIGVTYGSNNKYTSSGSFKKRESNIHYENGYIYVTQVNDGKVLHTGAYENEGDPSFVHKLSELKTIDDFFAIFSEAIGFTDSVHSAIVSAIQANNPDMRIESIIKNFTAPNNNYDYTVVLDGGKMVGDSNIGDITVSIKEDSYVTENNVKYNYIDMLNLTMSIKVIASTTLNLNVDLQATDEYVEILQNYFNSKKQ